MKDQWIIIGDFNGKRTSYGLFATQEEARTWAKESMGRTPWESMQMLVVQEPQADVQPACSDPAGHPDCSCTPDWARPQ